MKVKAIHHVAIILGNLEKCRDFYTQVLGLQELQARAFDYPVQQYQIDEYEQLHLTATDEAATPPAACANNA